MAHGHAKSPFYFISLPPLGDVVRIEVIFGVYAYLSEP